jgi:hypothetical protein
MFGVFVGFSFILLLGILIFKVLTAGRLYKSFGVKGLIKCSSRSNLWWIEYIKDMFSPKNSKLSFFKILKDITW